MAETLPEGTDQIKPGASGTARAPVVDASLPPADAADLKAKAQAKANEFGTMAADHARDYAEQGKERVSGVLTDVASLIDDNAARIDERLGGSYGDYARRASSYVSDAANGLDAKDVEDLLDDVRAYVRRSPRAAIAAATAAGFLAARVVKSGLKPQARQASGSTRTASGRSTRG